MSTNSGSEHENGSVVEEEEYSENDNEVEEITQKLDEFEKKEDENFDEWFSEFMSGSKKPAPKVRANEGEEQLPIDIKVRYHKPKHVENTVEEQKTEAEEQKTDVPKQEQESISEAPAIEDKKKEETVQQNDDKTQKQQIEVVVSDKKTEDAPSFEDAHRDVINKINSIEASAYVPLSVDDYDITSGNHDKYVRFVANPLILTEDVRSFNAQTYISYFDVYKYNPYDTPNMSMTHPLEDQVIAFKRFNDIFRTSENDIIPMMSMNVNRNLNDTDLQVCAFLEANQIKTSVVEYNLIRTFINKIIYALNSTTELAFREERSIVVDSKYRQAILGDVAMMARIQPLTEKTGASWKVFAESFGSNKFDNRVYVHKDVSTLSKHIDEAFKQSRSLEHLLGTMLKSYYPSVGIDYFVAIKCIYIIVRLITLYINKYDYIENGDDENPEIPSKDKLINDINTIVTVGVLIYENKGHLMQQTPKTLPQGVSDEKVQMYLMNHSFTGPQYYILKMYEKMLPVLGIDLFDHLVSVAQQRKIMNNAEIP